MNNDRQSIELYIGAQILYKSELLSIQQIISILERDHLHALIIANVNINSRQIDLIIALETKTIVVEVKGSHRPITGTVNGDWQMQLANGELKPIGNYYNQTLTGKHVVKDMITGILGNDPGYPDSLLLFQPYLPLGSNIPESDFKVTNKNLSELNSFDDFNATPGYTFDVWRKFILQQNLRRVIGIEGLYDPSLQEVETHLDQYASNYKTNYEFELQQYVPIEISSNNELIFSEQFAVQLPDFNNVVITGETGCGKSLLAKKLGIEIIDLGGIPVYLEAKYFDKLLGPLIDIEVGLLGYKKGTDLFNNAGTSNRPVYLIIDGFNECRDDSKTRLVRCLLALLRRYLIKIIIIGQNFSDDFKPLNARHFLVENPSTQIKQKIAGQFCDLQTLTVITPLLETISSCIEANIIGNLGKFNITEKSRFSRFDLFIRTKLDNSNHGIAILNKVAGFLAQKLSFTLSTREADILLAPAQLNGNEFDKVIKSGVIKVYGDKISFSHEEFLNTYIADYIVRQSHLNVEEILESLNEPRNRDRGLLIIGAIDDLIVLQAVLDRTVDYNIIVSCIKNECGSFAYHWAEAKVVTLFDSMAAEIEAIRFECIDDQFFRIIADPLTLCKWTKEEMALIVAAKVLLQEGYYFEKTMNLIGVMDLKIMDATIEISDATNRRKQEVFSDLFSSVYMSFGRKEVPAFTKIVSDIHSSFPSLSVEKHVPILDFIKLYLNANPEVGYGAFYFIMAFVRYEPYAHLLYPHLLDYTGAKSTGLPYHFRLEVFDRLPYCWKTEDERLALIENLNLLSSTNPFTSSSIFDALQGLGAIELDEIAYRSQAIEEIKRVLQEHENPEQWTAAYSIYYYQFDHPFGGAYTFAIDSLREEELKLFYLLAIKGATSDMFFPSLICRTERYAFEEYGSILSKWRGIPEKFGTMAQEEVNILYLSHIMVGRIKFQINTELDVYPDSWRKTLCASAELLYWVNRPDLEKNEIEEKAKILTAYLLDDDSEYAFDAVYQAVYTINSLRFEANKFIPVEQVLPELVLTLARKAVINRDKTRSIYQYTTSREVLSHAIYKIGQLGNLTDVLLLKKLVDEDELGSNAVDAIIKLQN